jgi:trk system potassium uptake protein TrkA
MIQEDQKSLLLGIDYFVHPDVETARAVFRAISHGAMGNILDFAGTSYELGSIIVAEGSDFDGLCLTDYRSVVKEDSLLTLVEKDSGSSVQCFFPTGRTILRKGDRVHILAPEDQMENLFLHAGLHEKPLRRIGIVGGGRIGSLIAEGLFNPVQKHIDKAEKKKSGILSILNLFTLKSSRRVVIIEQDYKVCKELSARFPDAIVLNEDISNENFILEERIGDLDLIITTTTSQELNIIAAIYLKSLGVKRAIAMVNGSGYENIARRLNVDVVIPVQSVVADSIISKLTGKGIREIHSLGDGTIEMFETEISGESPAAEKPITEFGMAKAGLIMLVKRDDVSFIPRGDYIFKPGDKLVIIVKSGSESELDKFFGITTK